MGRFRKGFQSLLCKARTVYAVPDSTGRHAIIEVDGEVRQLANGEVYPVLMCSNAKYFNVPMTAWFTNYGVSTSELFEICLSSSHSNAGGRRKMSMCATALQGGARVQDAAVAYTCVLDQRGMSAELLLQSLESAWPVLKPSDWNSILVNMATNCALEWYCRLVPTGGLSTKEIVKTVVLATRLAQDRNEAVGLLMNRLGEVRVGKGLDVTLARWQVCCQQAIGDQCTEQAINTLQPVRTRDGSSSPDHMHTWNSDVIDQMHSLPSNLQVFQIGAEPRLESERFVSPGLSGRSYGNTDPVVDVQPQSLPITISDFNHYRTRSQSGRTPGALHPIDELSSSYSMDTEETQEPHLPQECSGEHDSGGSFTQSYSVMRRESETSAHCQLLVLQELDCVWPEHRDAKNP